MCSVSSPPPHHEKIPVGPSRPPTTEQAQAALLRDIAAAPDLTVLEALPGNVLAITDRHGRGWVRLDAADAITRAASTLRGSIAAIDHHEAANPPPVVLKQGAYAQGWPYPVGARPPSAGDACACGLCGDPERDLGVSSATSHAASIDRTA